MKIEDLHDQDVSWHEHKWPFVAMRKCESYFFLMLAGHFFHAGASFTRLEPAFLSDRFFSGEEDVRLQRNLTQRYMLA